MEADNMWEIQIVLRFVNNWGEPWASKQSVRFDITDCNWCIYMQKRKNCLQEVKNDDGYDEYEWKYIK